MKHLLCFLLATVCCLLSISAQNPSVINGVWERERQSETVYLFAIENGSLQKLASSRIGANGEFALAFFPQEEGFFTIGLSRRADEIHTFYFKPGDNLNVRIFSEGFELIRENTPENLEMERWHHFTKPMTNIIFRRTGFSRTEIFPTLERKKTELISFPRANTPNAKFNNRFERYKEADFQYLILIFSLRAATFCPITSNLLSGSLEDFPDFSQSVSIESLTKDEFLLSFPNGIRLLSNIIHTKARLSGQMEQMRENPIDFYMNYPGLKSPIVKGELLLSLTPRIRTRADLRALQEQYRQYITTDSQRERMRAFEIALFQNEAAVATERVQAFDFTFPDVDGNQVSLSDFKGKVVYIDVWATWCRPCIAEKPALRNLQTEFNDRDIVFMSVSIDSQRDKERWREFLVAQNLSGVQLFAGDDAARGIMQPYGIRGIPHFILVGKDGKIILSNAPRPSSPQIRAVLNDALSR